MAGYVFKDEHGKFIEAWECWKSLQMKLDSQGRLILEGDKRAVRDRAEEIARGYPRDKDELIADKVYSTTPELTRRPLKEEITDPALRDDGNSPPGMGLGHFAEPREKARKKIDAEERSDPVEIEETDAVASYVEQLADASDEEETEEAEAVEEEGSSE